MTTSPIAARPPLPPFTRETAEKKVRMAEDAWNSRDPERVALAYTEDSRWRNRDQFFSGREAIKVFLTAKWQREIDYRLIKELWAYTDDHISVRFQYEWRDVRGDWYRAHGNEQWAFDAHGLMRRREASINDVPLRAEERKFLWDAPGPRPADHPGLLELGL
jgi:nuclear transport factor 2 (NTF2) superfamily protein